MLYRIPLFLPGKSNHIFTVWWQHMVLLLVMIRQYEGKRSYRLFVDWLVEEAYYLRIVLQLSQHTTTFHYSSEIHGKNHRYRSGKDNFIIHNSYKNRTIIIHWDRFIWVKATHASQYYTERAKPTRRRKYIIKLSLTAADILQQIICTIKIRRAPTRHDTIDFQPLITKTSEILPLSVVIGDKGYV